MPQERKPEDRLNRNKLKELEPVFYPRSIAVVGVSEDENKIASLWLNGLISRGFKGDLYAVNVKGGEIAGHTQMMHICETPGFHEKYYYWPGTTEFPVFDLGLRVGPCICYDRHYPEVMRILTLRGADVIVVQTAQTQRAHAGVRVPIGHQWSPLVP